MNKRYLFSLSNPLTEEDVNYVTQCAFEVLEKIGVECRYAPLMEKMRKRPRITVRGDRFYVRRDFMAEYFGKLIEKVKEYNLPQKPPEECRLRGGWPANCIFDIGLNEPRPVTTADCKRVARLGMALGIGASLTTPQDVPPILRPLRQVKATIEAAGPHGGLSGNFTTEAEADFIEEMYKVVGKKTSVSMAVMICISPLKINYEGLALIDRLCRQNKLDRIAISTGSMAQAGTTAPAETAALMVQGLADTLGADLAVHILTDGKAGPFGTHSSLFASDMQHMTISFGSPESIIFHRLGETIKQRYGLCYWAAPLNTTAKQIDAQAICQRVCSALLSALNGGRFMGPAGRLAVDEVISPELAVIDREIVSFINRIIQGTDVNFDRGAILDLIQYGAENGNYLTHPTTLNYCRHGYWRPKLFDFAPLGGWLAGDRKSLCRRATEEVNRLVDSYQYELAGDRQKELDRIWRKAEEALAK